MIAAGKHMLLFSLESCIIMCPLWKHDYTKVRFDLRLACRWNFVFLLKGKHRHLRTKFWWERLNLRTQSNKEISEYHSEVDNTSASHFGVSEIIPLDALQFSSVPPDIRQDSTSNYGMNIFFHIFPNSFINHPIFYCYLFAGIFQTVSKAL